MVNSRPFSTGSTNVNPTTITLLPFPLVDFEDRGPESNDEADDFISVDVLEHVVETLPIADVLAADVAIVEALEVLLVTAVDI